MEHQRVPRNTVTKRDEHWCTSGVQNRLVYPKSTRDEAHFPFIGSLAILCSTEYSRSGLTYWGNYRDYLRHPPQVYMNIHFRTAARRYFHAPHIFSRWELILCLWLKRWVTFPQAPQVEFSLGIGRWEGLCAFGLKWNVPREAWLKRRPDFPAVA